jgi:uncharacterized membrane protein YqjE
MAEPRPPGLLASLRQLLDSALALAQVRLALLGTELEEQKLRAGQSLLLGAIGLVLLTVALLLLCGLLLVLVEPRFRVAALAVLTIGFSAAGVLLLRAARDQLRTTGGLFQASLGELTRDRSALARQVERRP